MKAVEKPIAKNKILKTQGIQSSEAFAITTIDHQNKGQRGHDDPGEDCAQIHFFDKEQAKHEELSGDREKTSEQLRVVDNEKLPKLTPAQTDVPPFRRSPKSICEIQGKMLEMHENKEQMLQW